jgi:nickel transport protein
MPRIAALSALALAALSAQPAVAHGVWIAERWGELALVYGHGADDDPYKPEKVAMVRAFGETGAEVPVRVEPAGTRARLGIEGEPAVVVVDFDNGIYTERADGSWVNEPKSRVADAKAAGHYVKHNLTLVDVHDRLPELPPQALQIVPLEVPTEMRAGDRFRVRVLFQGRPLAGAAVIPDYVNMSGQKAGTTDAEGVAEVPIRNDGLNVVAVSHEVPLEGNPDADKRQHFATLAFALHHGEEE